MASSKKILQLVRSLSIILLAVCWFISAPSVSATVRDDDRQSIIYDTTFYDEVPQGACGLAGGTGSNVNPSAAQDEIAKTIMGIAKTENLGQQGALIGLMVGLTESRLTIYANSNVPASLANPAKQAVGSDHLSVGVFQQQVGFGWSTITPDSVSNKDAVWQLMDPAYSAEAFFGSPPGSNAPRALSKGLQNINGWQTMEPGKAAQAVQISAKPDAYAKNQPIAQDYINRLWDSSPAIALPVAFKAGTTSGVGAGGNCNGAVAGNLLQTIVNYAWHDYHKAPYFTPTNAYQNAYQAAAAKHEYVGGGVTDCGGFVTRVMHDSGADASYNNAKGPTTTQQQYMKSNPDKYQSLGRVKSEADLKPGDIAVNSQHTFIYVGSIPGFNGKFAEASLGDRTPMATPYETTAGYDWYRLIK